MTSSEQAVSAGDDDQAFVLELRQKLADAEEAHRASQAAVEANDALVAELKQDLEAAREVAGQAPASSLGAVQQETRINELQSVIVQLQTQLRQSEQDVARARAETETAQAGLRPMQAANSELQEQQAHLRRLLEQSEATVKAQQTRLDALLQQARCRSGAGRRAAAAAGGGRL